MGAYGFNADKSKHYVEEKIITYDPTKRFGEWFYEIFKYITGSICQVEIRLDGLDNAWFPANISYGFPQDTYGFEMRITAEGSANRQGYGQYKRSHDWGCRFDTETPTEQAALNAIGYILFYTTVYPSDNTTGALSGSFNKALEYSSQYKPQIRIRKF